MQSLKYCNKTSSTQFQVYLENLLRCIHKILAKYCAHIIKLKLKLTLSAYTSTDGELFVFITQLIERK